MRNHLNRLAWLAALLAWWPGLAAAQAPPGSGDGLLGEYYQGRHFEHFRQRRVDPVIDFYYRGTPPAAGVPAENFSVRWTGWFRPPTSGKYVLYIDVDDGARFWLNGHQLLNEWRGQSQTTYRLDLTLRAGQAYRLRLDYCQYGADACAQLAWVRPEQLAQAARAASWRNLWGLGATPPLRAIIPARYLFSHAPRALPPPVAPLPKPALPAVAQHRPVPARPTPQVVRPVARPAAPSQLTAGQPLAGVAAQLASGQAITLHALYFEQGKAELLPAVQASLDSLAAALSRYPTLRLEIQGHTDNQGDSLLNHRLSYQRAEAVRQYLVARGLVAERLHAVGYGGSRPAADNRAPALRHLNRRVVLQPLPH